MTDSPCRRKCCLDAKGFCTGCGRSIGEIAAWATLTDLQKAEILLRLKPSRSSHG
jgi:uncharacterized protein